MTLGALGSRGRAARAAPRPGSDWGLPHGPPGDQAAPHRHQGGDRGRGRAQPARTYREICALIQAANLTEGVKARSLLMFRLLGEVEARIHGQALETVDFHEWGPGQYRGCVVGVTHGLESMGISRVFCSPLPMDGA